MCGSQNGDLRVSAHDRLGEVLCILNSMLKKYPALHPNIHPHQLYSLLFNYLKHAFLLYCLVFSKIFISLSFPVCGSQNGDLRVSAHDRLGEVLCILNSVLKKYPALHTTDVLTSAAGLITKIKSKFIIIFVSEIVVLNRVKWGTLSYTPPPPCITLKVSLYSSLLIRKSLNNSAPSFTLLLLMFLYFITCL